jgi:hypothetical protein
MARKLQTFQTSQGFYDLAIAAPSTKAALAAWSAFARHWAGFPNLAESPCNYFWGAGGERYDAHRQSSFTTT